MYMNPATPRPDFAETLLLTAPGARGRRHPAASKGPGRAAEPGRVAAKPTAERAPIARDDRAAAIDPLEQMALAERADRGLLIMVAGVAAVTLTLALISSLL
jgi:hypothetical protein